MFEGLDIAERGEILFVIVDLLELDIGSDERAK